MIGYSRIPSAHFVMITDENGLCFVWEDHQYVCWGSFSEVPTKSRPGIVHVP